MGVPYAPRSIHDPITPEQAQYLPAFYWNVRTVEPTAQERQRQQNLDCAKARYQRVKAERLAQQDEAAWANKKLHKLTQVDDRNRPAKRNTKV